MMTLEKIKKYCDKAGYDVGPDAENIIKVINDKNGLCPCKFLGGTRCLCKEHKEEIEELGHCHCGLIYKKEL